MEANAVTTPEESLRHALVEYALHLAIAKERRDAVLEEREACAQAAATGGHQCQAYEDCHQATIAAIRRRPPP